MNKSKLYSLGFVCLFPFFGVRNFILAEKVSDVKNDISINTSLQKTNVKNKTTADTSVKVNNSKCTVDNAVNTTMPGNSSVGNSGSSESKSSKKLKIQNEGPKKNNNEIKEENYKKQDPSKVKNFSSKSANKVGSKKANLDETEKKAIYETPSAWSIESSKKDGEEEIQENFAATQQTSNNQYNDAKWLLYGGIGLAVFSVLGATFFILFLVKRNRRYKKKKENYHNEEWD